MTIPLIQNPASDGAAGTGTADSANMDYRSIDTGHHPASDFQPIIHIHVDALDGIARDVIEGYKALPKRGVEVGGLLLGRLEAANRNGSDGESRVPQIWVERFQRIPCEHRFGPQYVLDSEDQARLEEAAARIMESGDLVVLGAYRSHTRPGFQPEDSDREFVERYFRDATDLILLIKPESISDLSGQFFLRSPAGTLGPAGEVFPFHGRMLGMVGPAEEDDEAPTGKSFSSPERPAVASPPEPSAKPETRAPAARHSERETGETVYAGVRAADLAPEASSENNLSPDVGSGARRDLPNFRAARLVPDFVPAGDAPNPRPLFRTLDSFGNDKPVHDDHEEGKGFFEKWWPLLGAIVLVCGALAVLFWPGQNAGSLLHRGGSPANAANSPTPTTFRPLGLYVDPSGPEWRITWNQTATPLAEARGVGLFVREGDDQNRIDLSPADLKSGTYQYKPKGNDVTFRLEVTDASGRVTGESFRVIRSTSKGNGNGAESRNAPPEKAATGNPSAPAPGGEVVSPKAIHKVPPVVPASIRPRIHGSIPIDVRVRVDTKGKVLLAVPTRKFSGLEAFLAQRAVAAARQWRFTPARQDGKPVQGSQIIHFTFDR